MKPLIISLLMGCALFQGSYAQNQHVNAYVCESGKIHFYASTPIQDIEATSNSALCVINTQTRKISAKVQMETFAFRRQKMQEDFNEDYAESAKYPYATLDALIEGKVNWSKDGTYDVTLKGTFEIHGVKKETEIKGKLAVKNGEPVSATAEFDVALADYNIKIPTVVVAKIAKLVRVDATFDFRKYQKGI